MYHCDTCKAHFPEPVFDHSREYHSEVECSEELCRPVCPVCGSEEIREEADW